jgi:hypothetical protein
MARSLQVYACRAHPLVGWLVTKDPPDYPGKVIARLVTDLPSPYLLVADTLAEIHAALPSNLAQNQQSCHQVQSSA